MPVETKCRHTLLGRSFRSKQTCRICMTPVDGDMSPAFLKTTNKTTEFKFASALNLHMAGSIHNPAVPQFCLWAADRATLANGSYRCPLVGCDITKTFPSFKLFKEHVRQSHDAFFNRLQHQVFGINLAPNIPNQ